VRESNPQFHDQAPKPSIRQLPMLLLRLHGCSHC
jgi:hypothetical protein